MDRIPEGWKKVYLAGLIVDQIKNGYSPNATDYITGYWVLGLGALGEDSFNAAEVKPVKYTKEVQSAMLAFNDFLISRSNTPDKVGRSARYRDQVVNCSYPDLMMRFRIDPKKADLDFIEHKLKSSDVKNYYKNCAAGSSSTMVKINKSIVEKTPLILPSLPEQREIAKILSTWDKAINTTQALIDASKQQKKALMQQLLTGKKRFPGFDGKWVQTSVKKVMQIKKGEQINKSTLSDCGPFPVINGGISPSGYTESSNCLGNTITISEGGNSCGYISFQKEDFWCGGHCYALSDLKLSTEFTYQLLKYNQDRIMKLRVGSGLPNIQKKDIENLKITYPETYEEDQKIAAILFTADKEIERLKKKLVCLKQEKKALMQQLLTGKRRIKLEEKYK